MLKVILCAKCKHFDKASPRLKRTCVAFPDGIPKEILMGDFDHQEPHPLDNGITFEDVSTDVQG